MDLAEIFRVFYLECLITNTHTYILTHTHTHTYTHTHKHTHTSKHTHTYI